MMRGNLSITLLIALVLVGATLVPPSGGRESFIRDDSGATGGGPGAIDESVVHGGLWRACIRAVSSSRDSDPPGAELLVRVRGLGVEAVRGVDAIHALGARASGLQALRRPGQLGIHGFREPPMVVFPWNKYIETTAAVGEGLLAGDPDSRARESRSCEHPARAAAQRHPPRGHLRHPGIALEPRDH